MECPKCGLEIDDKAMVCPNCKKVLKLVCPICKTINTTNTCKNCGYVIINKCHNCGKINQTISKKCRKCGFDTEKSVIMNEANTDSFAMLSIDFPNLSDMKMLLGSAKLYNKFKINLDKIIADYAKSIGLRRQLIGKTYVIRCDRDYTFNSSVYTAIKAAIELLNLITEMNCKLSKKKQASIRCNMFILKRTVEDDPEDTNFGINISLLYNNNDKNFDKILNTFQILADENVSDILSGEYNISRLNSVKINNEMVSISEIDVKELVKVEYPEDESDDIKVPNFVQNMLVEQDKLDGDALNSMNSYGSDPDSIYDIDTINFDEINCEFLRTENTDVLFHITNIFQNKPQSIVALKTAEMYKPYTLKVLNAAAETGHFENIVSLTCYDEMKYAPYSFFREFISAIFGYTISQKLFFENDFSMFKSVDPDGLVRDLITLSKRPETDNIDTRYVYFDIFLTLMQIIPKTLIFVEDFEKIDSSSYEILKYLFSSFEQLDIGFLISYDKEFSLHKDCHFLLTKSFYSEITLKPATFERIIEDNRIFYKDIMNDFYFQRIAKYSCGSSLFIDIAIQYLIESGVYEADETTIQMVNPKTVIIPSNLDKLVARRLNLLQDDAQAMKFLTSIVLLGTRVDMGTINTLGYENKDEILNKLADMGYLYEYNECIYFPNYNLLRRNLLSTISPIYLREIAQDLFDKVLDDSGIPSPTEAYLYGLLEEDDKERNEWKQLAEANLSFGDFSAYISCAERILQILDKNEDPDKEAEIAEYKTKIYENIAENLMEYEPSKNSDIVQTTLAHIESTADTDRIIRLCNKMIDGAINSGSYNHALDLMHKVLSMLPSSSINPADDNFNKYFFLMSIIHIQILFNIGSLTDCLDVGYKVLSVITDENLAALKPDYFSDEDFRQLLVDSVGYVALTNVMSMGGNVRDFLGIVRNEMSFIPASFDLFIELENLIHGKEIGNLQYDIVPEDKFGWVILNIVSAFVENKGDNKIFAEYVYKAKVAAKSANIKQLEIFADLMIAYAYLNIGLFKKAEFIIFNIIRESGNKGMTVVLFAAWYVMSELHLKQGNYDVAFGIVNNSLIQLEKNNSTGEYLLMLFKYNMYKIMMFKQQYEKADICIAHAKYIASKYGINFNFDTNRNSYVSNEEPQENDLSVNPMIGDLPINMVSGENNAFEMADLDALYPQDESEGE